MTITFTISEQGLRRLGIVGVQRIQSRTEKGLDVDGKAFPDYSTDWFFRPVGGHTRSQIAELKKLQQIGEVQFITRNQQALWMLVHGYDIYKRNLFPQEYTGRVNLRQTGAMMDALTVIRVEGNRVTIGFADVDQAEKAYYNEEGKEKRRFMGLTALEQEELARIALQYVEIRQS